MTRVERSDWPYLPPSTVGGCAYCLDPDSRSLRTALTQPRLREDALVQGCALLEDLEFFHRLLQKQYAGYPDLLQHRDFDPGAFFARWAETVRRAGDTVSCREGVLEPLVALRRVVPDNHLTFPGLDAALTDEPRLTFDEFQAAASAASAGTRLESLEAPAVPGVRLSTLRIAPMLQVDGGVTAIVTVCAPAASPILTIQCGDRTVELTRRPPAPFPALRPPRIPAYEWQAIGDTTVVTLRAFAGPAAVRTQLQQFAADHAIHTDRPKILFDLRGNGGGTLEYVHQWIHQARRGEWDTYPRMDVVGALWPCSEWNVLVERQILEGLVDSAEAKAERERLRGTWSAHPPTHASSLDLGRRSSRGDHPYAGRVFVLVNKRSGSSGELAAVVLKRALNAVIIGERTRGTMQYGQVRRLVLPRTGLLCQLPTRRFFFDEEVEAVGWPVDCYLQDIGQDASGLVPYLDLLSQRVGAASRAGGTS